MIERMLGAKPTCAIDDIDIEKSEEGECKMSACCGKIPVLCCKRVLNWMECHNLLKKDEHRIAGCCMWEVGEWSITSSEILARDYELGRK